MGWIRTYEDCWEDAPSVTDRQDGAVGVLDDGVGGAAHERP